MRPLLRRTTVVPLALAFATLALLALAACTETAAPTTAFPTVRIANGTSEAIAYFAIPAEDTPLIDIAPSVAGSALPVVEAGAEQVATISGLGVTPQPSGVAFFLYRLTPSRDSAHFGRMVLYATDELRRTGGRAAIPAQVFENR